MARISEKARCLPAEGGMVALEYVYRSENIIQATN